MAKTDIPNGSFPAQKFGSRKRHASLTPEELQGLADKIMQAGRPSPSFLDPPQQDYEDEDA